MVDSGKRKWFFSDFEGFEVEKAWIWIYSTYIIWNLLSVAHPERSQYKQMGPIMHHICFFAVSSSLLVFWFGPACNTTFPSHRVLFSFKKNITRNPLILLASKEKSKEKGKLCSLLSSVLLKWKLKLWPAPSIVLYCLRMYFLVTLWLHGSWDISTWEWLWTNMNRSGGRGGCWLLKTAVPCLELFIYTFPQTETKLRQLKSTNKFH